MKLQSYRRNGWQLWHPLAALALGALGMAATWDSWYDIFQIAWRDEESSHILLVPVVMLWLLWVRRGRLRQCRPTGTWVGPVLVAIGWALYAQGDTRLIEAFWHFGAVLVVVGCILTILGKDVLLRFLPAFAVLVFLVPVPGTIRGSIALPLEQTTAHVTATLCDMLGIPVIPAGNALHINGMVVGIAEACNGLRMVFTLLLVSFAFAFGTPLRAYARALVLIASPVSAIVCNVIRLIPTVLLYGYAPKPWADWFHTTGGWVMVGVAFAILMGMLAVLRWALVPVTQYTLAYD